MFECFNYKNKWMKNVLQVKILVRQTQFVRKIDGYYRLHQKHKFGQIRRLRLIHMTHFLRRELIIQPFSRHAHEGTDKHDR